tara:strand:- start:397 stop:624 length:228 start_codon:yes stop_codon:yes gene_type:complete
MQKFINVIAVSSGLVSLAIVVGGVCVYVNRDSIIDGVKSQVLESVTGSLPGLGGLGGTAAPAPLGDFNTPVVPKF